MHGENFNSQDNTNPETTEWDALIQEVPFQDDKQSFPEHLNVTELKQINILSPEVTSFVLNKAHLLLDNQHKRGEITDEDYRWDLENIQEEIPDTLSDDNTKKIGMGIIDVAYLHATKNTLDAINKVVVSELMQSYLHPEMQLAFGIANYSALQIANIPKRPNASDSARMHELSTFQSIAERYLKSSSDIEQPNRSFADFVESWRQSSQSQLEGVIARNSDTIPTNLYLNATLLTPDNTRKYINKINDIQKEMAEIA